MGDQGVLRAWGRAVPPITQYLCKRQTFGSLCGVGSSGRRWLGLLGLLSSAAFYFHGEPKSSCPASLLCLGWDCVVQQPWSGLVGRFPPKPPVCACSACLPVHLFSLSVCAVVGRGPVVISGSPAQHSAGCGVRGLGLRLCPLPVPDERDAHQLAFSPAKSPSLFPSCR